MHPAPGAPTDDLRLGRSAATEVQGEVAAWSACAGVDERRGSARLSTQESEAGSHQRGSSNAIRCTIEGRARSAERFWVRLKANVRPLSRLLFRISLLSTLTSEPSDLSATKNRPEPVAT